MAAAKELLRAAGLHEKRRSSSSTATEHTTSLSQLDPAVSTEEIFVGVGSKEKGFFIGGTDVHKIVELLMWMAQDFQSDIHIDDIYEAALAAVLKHLDTCGGTQAYSCRSRNLLHTTFIAKLPELIDIMML